jgi:6,7-dimethyl-8-ribityllumazine synthase
MLEILEGDLRPNEARYVILAARFNELVVESLVAGAIDCLRRHGIDDEQISVVRCPGAYEMPVVARRLIDSGRFDAMIAVGCVIRGGTPHFDHVSAGAMNGLSALSTEHGFPIGMGVLTTDSLEQAFERAGSKAGNKGHEAAIAVLEVVNLLADIDSDEASE